MATKIVTKNSSTASAVPTASDLVQGELAVNVADKRLFTEDNGGAIVELGTNPSTLNVDGTATMDGLTVDGAALFTTADNSDTLSLISTDADASVGPNLNLYRNSGSPADNDALGKIVFKGRNDNSQDVTYGLMEAYLLDASDGTEDGEITIRSMVGGTSTNRLDIVPTETVFNQSSKDLDFRVESDGNTHMLFVDGGLNRVGIGTSSPAQKLHINDSAPFARLESTSTSYNGFTTKNDSGNFYFGIDDSGGNFYGSAYARAIYADGAYPVTFYTNGAERMRIDSSGNLLVGTTATDPAASSTETGVALKGGGFVSISRNDTAASVNINKVFYDGSIVDFRKDGAIVGSIGTVAGRLGIGTGDAGLFFDDDNNKISPVTMVSGTPVDSDGLLDLGYSAARFKDLYLSGNVNIGNGSVATGGDNYVYSYSGGSSGQVRSGIKLEGSTNTLEFYTGQNEAMRIDSSGNLALGDSNAYTHRLFVKGVGTNEAVGLTVGTNGNNVIRFYNSGLGTAGAITVNSGGTTVAYNTSSDQRLKENIADADDAGSKIDAIQVRKYDWKADGSHQDYGMIAQELQAVAPEAVSGDADSEEMMGVDYSKLVPMLIKEIQSLRNRVAQLEE